MKINKRGQGHVEMIISFILFVGAVLFIFFYINPFTQTVDKSGDMERVQSIIIKNISATVGRLSIIGTGCYHFEESQYGTNYVEVLGDNILGKKQYTIYFGEPDVFNKSAPHRDTCPLNYQLGVFSNETIISYERLLRLAIDIGNDAGNTNPLTDYKKVKQNLGINMNFLINCTDLNGNVIPDLSFSKNIPPTTEVESRQLPMVLINKNGQANQIILNLKAW
jgi:hypothetical protein